MKDYLLINIGTCGDVYPFIDVGIALRARGHRVTLASDERYRSVAIGHGLEFSMIATEQQTDELFSHPDLFHPRKSIFVGGPWIARHIKFQYQRILETVADREVILVSGPLVPAARILHDKLGIPHASLCYTPFALPSYIAPPAIMGGPTLPSWMPRPLGKLYWRMVDRGAMFLMGRAINHLRRTLQLDPIRRYLPWVYSGPLTLATFPDWFAARQPDWPANVEMVGFSMFDGETHGELDQRVLEFCRQGPKPVVFTFGTGIRNSHDLFRAAIDACRLNGKRGILLTRHRNEVPDPLPDFMRTFDFVSHRNLFPECELVVHHGGIGTVAKAFASGRPQLIIPHAYDQRDNGKRVQRLGAGEIIDRKKATPERLAHFLRTLDLTSIRARCRDLASRFPAPAHLFDVTSLEALK